MAMNMGSSKGPVADMNVTPMIDVLLVLIIVFMIIHTSTASTGLEALVPQPPVKASEIPPESTVVIQVLDNGPDRPRLEINRQPVAWELLHARLIEIYKIRATRILFVKADRNLDFEQIAAVIDTAHGAFQDMKIGLITS